MNGTVALLVSRPQMINLNVGNALTSHLAPPAGQSFHMSGDVSQKTQGRLVKHFLLIFRMNPTDFGDPLR